MSIVLGDSGEVLDLKRNACDPPIKLINGNASSSCTRIPCRCLNEVPHKSRPTHTTHTNPCHTQPPTHQASSTHLLSITPPGHEFRAGVEHQGGGQPLCALPPLPPVLIPFITAKEGAHGSGCFDYRIWGQIEYTTVNLIQQVADVSMHAKDR